MLLCVTPHILKLIISGSYYSASSSLAIERLNALLIFRDLKAGI